VLFVTIEVMRIGPGADFAKLPVNLSVALIIAMLAASLGLASLSYRFVEVAGRRWVRGRLGVRRSALHLSAAGGRVA
jgi:peptidoglycan/LPS O-acetylase OafA/YrhL